MANSCEGEKATQGLSAEGASDLLDQLTLQDDKLDDLI